MEPAVINPCSPALDSECPERRGGRTDSITSIGTASAEYLREANLGRHPSGVTVSERVVDERGMPFADRSVEE